MTSKALLMALATLAGTSSAAIARNDIVFSKDGSRAFVTSHESTHFTPNFVKKSLGATIYSNLATAYPKGLYWAFEGSSLGGAAPYTQFVAGGFTPTANATAVEAQVAVGNFGDGKDMFTLSIYSDSAGVPGQVLASTKITSTTAFGTCCGLITAKFKGGVPLTAGTPYWLAITLSAKQLAAGDDGAWNLATTDQVDAAPFAYNENNTGWNSSPTTQPPAFAVYSK